MTRHPDGLLHSLCALFRRFTAAHNSASTPYVPLIDQSVRQAEQLENTMAGDESDQKAFDVDLKITHSPESACSGTVEAGRELETVHVIDHHAERALCWKFDCRILPVLAFMCVILPRRASGESTDIRIFRYLCNALDKGNLGNAKTDGLEKDLNFKSDQYNIILSVFYVPYVLCAPPVAILGKKIGPHRMLPILMFIFGAFTLLGAGVKNFGGMMTIRWFLVLY